MPTSKRPRILVLLTTLAVLTPASLASASTRQFTTFEAPSELLFSGSPDAALDTIAGLGTTAIRIQLAWDLVAPDADARTAPAFNQTDPDAYPAANWARYDAVIAAARARGMKVLLTIAGGAPRWATASKRDHLTRPSATAFGKFATAVGRRYRSQVSWWSIWNEPNLGKLLKPIYKGRGNGTLASAPLYRQLYLKAYSGLRAAHVSAPILFGELAPQANSLHDNGTVAPLRFLRGVLCLDSRYRKVGKGCAKLATQGFAMHPYTTAVGPRFQPPDPDNVTIGVLGRLTHALDRAASVGAVPRKLPVYVTEFGVQSLPDPRLGVSLAKQSDYRALAEYLAYANPRVKSFSQYLLRDDDPRGGAYSAFESGLLLFEGLVPKPSFDSFRTPLVAIPRRDGRVKLWGLVRPAHGTAGTVTIESRDPGHGWRRVAAQRYGASGYWTRAVTGKRNRAWRVRWIDGSSVEHVGPATLAR
jgi:hypothetical protein